MGGAQAGLYAANCTGLYVIDNYCFGDTSYFDGTPNTATSTTTTSAHRKSGFSFYNCSAGCQVCDNVLGGTTSSSGIGYGLLASSYCDHLQITNNNFNQSYYGITLQSSGIANVLGNQGGPGLSQENSFLGTGGGSFTSSYRTESYINITDSNYIRPIFYYKAIYPVTTPEPSYTIFNGTGSSSSIHRIFGLALTITDGEVYDLCTPIWPSPITYPSIINILSRMDTVVSQGNTRYSLEPDFDSTSVWLPEKMVYESLYNDTALLDTDSVANTFYVNMGSSDIASILQSELLNIMLTDSTIVADTIIYKKYLETAQSASSGIPDTNIRAANYIAMSNLYLNTIAAGIDTFTSGQLDTIAGLAIQCPYAAGDAVYMARALYAQYDNSVFFDDLVLCTPEVSGSLRSLEISNTAQDSTKPQATPDYILVYPNPAKNMVKVFYSSSVNPGIMFDLTDVTGQKILSVPVANLSTAEINVSEMASGLYLWKARVNTSVVKTGKVSIQK